MGNLTTAPPAGSSSVRRSRQLGEACQSTWDCRRLEIETGQAVGVKVRQGACQAGGGEEVLAWKPWKVEAWNSRQLTSAGKKAGQDDALTNLGKRDIFCGFSCQKRPRQDFKCSLQFLPEEL